MTPEWIIDGAKLLGVATPVAFVAGAVAWLVARTAADHSSKQFLQTHKGALDRVLADHLAELEGKADERRLVHKRQELMFEREVDAARAFFKLYDEIYPKGGGPEPDWHADSVPYLATRYGEIESRIGKFLRDHSLCILTKRQGWWRAPRMQHEKVRSWLVRTRWGKLISWAVWNPATPS